MVSTPILLAGTNFRLFSPGDATTADGVDGVSVIASFSKGDESYQTQKRASWHGFVAGKRVAGKPDILDVILLERGFAAPEQSGQNRRFG